MNNKKIGKTATPLAILFLLFTSCATPTKITPQFLESPTNVTRESNLRLYVTGISGKKFVQVCGVNKINCHYDHFGGNIYDIKDIITKTVMGLLGNKGYNVSIVEKVPKNTTEPLLYINIEKMDIVWQTGLLSSCDEISMTIKHKMFSSSNNIIFDYTFAEESNNKNCIAGTCCIFPYKFIMKEKITEAANQYLKEYAEALQSKIPVASK